MRAIVAAGCAAPTRRSASAFERPYAFDRRDLVVLAVTAAQAVEDQVGREVDQPVAGRGARDAL